jgi:hypothetical protein
MLMHRSDPRVKRATFLLQNSKKASSGGSSGEQPMSVIKEGPVGQGFRKTIEEFISSYFNELKYTDSTAFEVQPLG